MYEHADQSWRSQPRVMSDEQIGLLATRIAEYVDEVDLAEIVVVFHGGEPLLAGVERVVAVGERIRRAVRHATIVNLSMQTNGVLLDVTAVDTLAAAGIGISLSIDGAKPANDRHRITVRGRSSFKATFGALQRLIERPRTFSGAISVIDTAVPPRDLLEFFDANRPPQIDFLLPDANHIRQPPGRNSHPDVYVDWLTEAFDIWFDEFAHLPMRTFDALLAAVSGGASRTDAFGFGDVSLLTIETDGSYHDLDVLKITEDGGTAIGLSLSSASISAAARSKRIEDHRRLLRPEGLSAQCQSCPEVTVCGGGAVPHRFDHDGFDHPTVYCEEMLTLIRHVRHRLTQAVAADTAAASTHDRATSARPFDGAVESSEFVSELLSSWGESAAVLLASILPADALATLQSATAARLSRVAIDPTVVVRVKVAVDERRGVLTRSLDGRVISADPVLAANISQMLEQPARTEWLRVHADQPWLRAPFGGPIEFENNHELIEEGRALVSTSEAMIRAYSPALHLEIASIDTDVQFIRDLDADPDKCVSFSDDIVPGALYVSIRHNGGLIDAVDLADSLIHEHRHQKLYLLGRHTPLVERDYPLVQSPWRNDPRPPSGLLHAAFVFAELRRFWTHIANEDRMRATRAKRYLDVVNGQLQQAWVTLATAPLTPAGRELAAELEHSCTQR